jgi:hypothetical protein
VVIVSSTVASGEVADKFLSVTNGVVSWEQAIQDNMLYTGDVAQTDRENVLAQTQLNIIAAHPIVTGLSGTVTLSDTPTDMAWGLPGGGSLRIGQVTDGTPRFPLYVYDTGALLVDGATPAAGRRVNLPMSDGGYLAFNATGKQIVHNAILWAMGKPLGDTTQPTASILRSGGNITVSSSSGGTVQAAAALASPTTWTDLGAAPQTVPISGNARFFRIRK